ncbi:MAG: shikimate dehydrogenase, partial [Clostridiaceae bacterium]|nr:shikimate dehydrogenase [Clostridiaceae bacterium]
MSRSFRSRLTGVFGYPVDENPSIVMEEAAFAAAGIDWRYLTLLVKPEDLPAAVEGMRAMNFDGVNLTIPHKTAIIPLLDDITDSARLIGAVNTVYREGDKLIGTNTDGKGFVEGLNQRGIKLKNQHLVILGAGGAARAIAVESALAGCSSITIINRNRVRGESLRDLINQKTEAQSDYVEWVPGVRIPACDFLINATNVGLFPDESCPDI